MIHPITSAIEPIDLAKLFPAEQPLELELGCGDGSLRCGTPWPIPTGTSSHWSGCSGASPSSIARGIVPV